VPAGPTDASEGGIRAAENCVAGRFDPKTSALLPCYLVQSSNNCLPLCDFIFSHKQILIQYINLLVLKKVLVTALYKLI
jgi:hypothetical protein